MGARGHEARWVVCIIIYIISQQETSTLPQYTLATDNGKDPLIVSNHQIYLQRRITHRIPCRKPANGTAGVNVVTWYKERLMISKKKKIIREVLDPAFGKNYTAPRYKGRVSLTPDYDLILGNVNEGDVGNYTCEIITHSSKHDVNYYVDVGVIDDKLPKRSADKSVSVLLQSGENIIQCPDYTESLTRPTVYWSLQREAWSQTDVLGARFSDGVILRKDPNFDIQQVANYSLVIANPKAVPQELLVWCHVSSDVDRVNLMSDFINTTQSKPDESSEWKWILLWAFVGLFLVIVIGVIVCFICKKIYTILKKKQHPGSPDEKTPMTKESCEGYRVKKVIHAREAKRVLCCRWKKEEDFSSLKLVTVAGCGDVVLFDDKAIHVVSKTYRHKDKHSKWASAMDEYVAIAASTRSGEEILAARKNGTITWLNIRDAKEVEIDGIRNHRPQQISDMDVDDMGTIYAADVKENEIYTFAADGSFKSSFAVNGSPKSISASGDGILYVLSETSADGSEICSHIIKKYMNSTREDYDIKCPTHINFVPTRLYSNETSLFVVNKSERSAEEASSILEFSATDGHYRGCIIEGWPGIVGMVFIRGYEELAAFDSKQVKIYNKSGK